MGTYEVEDGRAYKGKRTWFRSCSTFSVEEATRSKARQYKLGVCLKWVVHFISVLKLPPPLFFSS